MNIQDTVYIIDGAMFHDINVKNGISIYKGEVIALRQKSATIKIELDTSPISYYIKDVAIEYLVTTPQKALEIVNINLLNKDKKDEPINIQQS